MTDTAATGDVRTQTDGHVLRIEVDNVAKKNAFTPDMMEKLSEAFTALDKDDALWVAVLCWLSTCEPKYMPQKVTKPALME